MFLLNDKIGRYWKRPEQFLQNWTWCVHLRSTKNYGRLLFNVLYTRTKERTQRVHTSMYKKGPSINSLLERSGNCRTKEYLGPFLMYWNLNCTAKKIWIESWAGNNVGYAPKNAYRFCTLESKRVYANKDSTFIEKLMREKNQVTWDINDTTSVWSNHDQEKAEITVVEANSEVEEINEENTDYRAGKNNDLHIEQS